MKTIFNSEAKFTAKSVGEAPSISLAKSVFRNWTESEVYGTYVKL